MAALEGCGAAQGSSLQLVGCGGSHFGGALLLAKGSHQVCQGAGSLWRDSAANQWWLPSLAQGGPLWRSAGCVGWPGERGVGRVVLIG